MTIVVHEDAIVAVLPSKQFRPTSSLKVIEERGKFVIPGLWDIHVHFRDATRDLKMDIANGVLDIRNMGGAPKDVFPLRDETAAGSFGAAGASGGLIWIDPEKNQIRIFLTHCFETDGKAQESFMRLASSL